jgi:hypothetical protein
LQTDTHALISALPDTGPPPAAGRVLTMRAANYYSQPPSTSAYQRPGRPTTQCRMAATARQYSAPADLGLASRRIDAILTSSPSCPIRRDMHKSDDTPRYRPSGSASSRVLGRIRLTLAVRTDEAPGTSRAGHDCRIVASSASRPWLPLRVLADPDRQSRPCTAVGDARQGNDRGANVWSLVQDHPGAIITCMVAGSGNAQFGDGPSACAEGRDLPMAGHDPPEPRLTMSDVRSLLECVQQLVDSQPSGGYTVEWCVKAAHIGDLNALSAAVIRAARYTATPH